MSIQSKQTSYAIYMWCMIWTHRPVYNINSNPSPYGRPMGKCNVGTAHFRNSRVTMPRVRTPPLSNAAMTYRRGATFASSHHICIQRCQKRLRCTCSSHLCIKSVTCLLVFYLVLSCLLSCASRKDCGAPAAYIICKRHHVRLHSRRVLSYT